MPAQVNFVAVRLAVQEINQANIGIFQQSANLLNLLHGLLQAIEFGQKGRNVSRIVRQRER